MKKSPAKSSAELSTSKKTASATPKKRAAGGADTLTPTPLTQVVELLDQQIAKQRQRQEKAVAKAARPSVKMARHALAVTLLRSLELYWGEVISPDEATAKALTKTVKRMAGQLIKQHRKQKKSAAVDLPAVLALPLVVDIGPAVALPPPAGVIGKNSPAVPTRTRAARPKTPVGQPTA